MLLTHMQTLSAKRKNLM